MKRPLYDSEILEYAMNNAYAIITGETTFELLMELHDEIPLPFNIQEEDPDYEGMIEYFIETEEYEKCAVLQKLIDKKQ